MLEYSDNEKDDETFHVPVSNGGLRKLKKKPFLMSSNVSVQSFAGSKIHYGASNPPARSLDVEISDVGSLFRKNHELPNAEPLINHPDSFFHATKTVVAFAQYFALLPVSGIDGPNYKSMSIRWFHFKILYWLVHLLATLFYFSCYIRYSLRAGIYTRAAGKLIFFGSGIISSFTMLHLAYNWRKLNEDFYKMESKFRKFGYPKKLKLKFKILTIAFFVLSVVEFLLSKITLFSGTSFGYDRHGNIFAILKEFFLESYKEVFTFHPYHLIAGFLMFAINFRMSTVWTFQDLFLAFVSRCISERFNQICSSLNEVIDKEMPLSFWREMREHYNTLTILTKKVDIFIQKIMLLTIGNDLFSLCITLFNSLQNETTISQLVYFIWSFGFHVLKTVFVAFSAAQINDISKEPKIVLYSVPSNNYSIEVRRFLTQLTTNEVALTGCGFFSVTRSLLLTIIGTVVTYEIVLVQFNNSSDYGYDPRNNVTTAP